MLPGGQSRARQAFLQPGQMVEANWHARLPEQLGSLRLEATQPYPSAVLDDSRALAALASACALVEQVLPEREPHPAVYESLGALIETLSSPIWPYVYVRWELGLLSEIGYGIEFETCALTGAANSEDDPIAFVSPRTGHAVCRSAAAPYKGKLLKLPGFLLGLKGACMDDVQDGLVLTGFFLERAAHALHHAPLPAPRARLVEKLWQPSVAEAG